MVVMEKEVVHPAPPFDLQKTAEPEVRERAMIRVDDVDFCYGIRQVLFDINLEIPPRAVTAFIGPSGCGKTTALKMVNRLIEPSSGKIYINGKDTDSYDPVELRRTIGYVIQQIGLFPNMTVQENICLVPK